MHKFHRTVQRTASFTTHFLFSNIIITYYSSLFLVCMLGERLLLLKLNGDCFKLSVYLHALKSWWSVCFACLEKSWPFETKHSFTFQVSNCLLFVAFLVLNGLVCHMGSLRHFMQWDHFFYVLFHLLHCLHFENVHFM